MFDKFGEFDSAEEINRAAAARRAEGDTEALMQIAIENGIDKEDAKDYADGIVGELTTPLLAALGKLEVESRELKLAGVLDYNKVKGFKDKQKVTEDARAQFYFAVDQPFRQWLQAIDPEQDDPDEAALRWQAQARSIAEKLGKQMVMEAGNAALKGHRIEVEKTQKTENKSKTILYTSPKAYNRFRTRLWEIYPKTES